MRNKASITTHGKASSTWRNRIPPSNQKISTAKVIIPITFTIPVGWILLSVIAIVVIWSVL
jgi:hypothetical protein